MRVDLMISLALLAWHFTSTTLVLRYVQTFSPVKVHLASSISAGIAFVLIGAIYIEIPTFNAWPGIALLAFGCMIFLIAYSAIYKSISLRLLIEVAHANPYAVSIVQLHEKTVLPPFLDRIKMLEATNYLVNKDGRITVTEHGRWIASKLNYWRMILGFTQSGLYYEPNSKSYLTNDEL
jgi:hypothetical protein